MPRRSLSEGTGKRSDDRSDARALAHGVLVRVETTDAFADVLLGERLAGVELGFSDRALATRLVYGTLAWQGRLDHHLAALTHRPIADLDPVVRAALRLGLYQVLFLERVPAYAAVDASVRLARASGRGAGGLVNAVLRRAARAGRGGLALPDATAEPLERLSVEWSHPRWLVERWASELGAEELPRLLAANNRHGASAIRVNAGRGTREALLDDLAAAGVGARASAWAAHAVLIERGAGRLRQLAGWSDGRFAFQGEASQLVAPLLGAIPGARVLDACAAPGGKSFHIAALLDGPRFVVALDRRTQGLRRVRAEGGRLGLEVHALAGDARRPPCRGPFDAVLVDAPCSGLGTLRRHPELRWRRRPDDIARLAALQHEILAGVAPLVRPGGVLVYAVCTLAREENEDVVAELRAAAPRFAIEPVSQSLPSLPHDAVTAEGFLRTLPHRHGLDGFFAARLRARA